MAGDLQRLSPHAIEELDAMKKNQALESVNSIKDAVDYLLQNFKDSVNKDLEKEIETLQATNLKLKERLVIEREERDRLAMSDSKLQASKETAKAMGYRDDRQKEIAEINRDSKIGVAEIKAKSDVIVSAIRSGELKLSGDYKLDEYLGGSLYETKQIGSPETTGEKPETTKTDSSTES